MIKKVEEKKEDVKVKKEKPSIKDKLAKRKKIIREKLLELLKAGEGVRKFDANRYVCGSGGRGYLSEILDGFNPHDRKLFKQTLHELCEEGALYHIGGAMYTTTKK
jgi:hypothetical protein